MIILASKIIPFGIVCCANSNRFLDFVKIWLISQPRQQIKLLILLKMFGCVSLMEPHVNNIITDIGDYRFIGEGAVCMVTHWKVVW